MGAGQRDGWLAPRGMPLRGEVVVPGDKSVSHRAVMLAALADGVSHIDGFLERPDTRATAAIFAQMGVRIEAPSASTRIVPGASIDGTCASPRLIDYGKAGHGIARTRREEGKMWCIRGIVCCCGLFKEQKMTQYKHT